MRFSANIDYASLYFKYKSPFPISGEPTYKSLKRLKTELRANASSVDTDLGGGDHGYLGLVLSDVEYMRIIPTPAAFVAPNFPGALVIDPAFTAIQAVQARETHAEDMALYRECKNVEKALLRHIQTAVEDKYLEFMVDDDTGLIEDDIPTVLAYLFSNYGKVTSLEVKEQESEVLNLTFNPADPMITIFRPIEQLQKKATEAEIPYSEKQILEFGLTLIRNTRDFEKAIGEWNSRANKTWDSFKTHFRNAQTELKEIRGPTMQQAGYHHANMLASQMRVDLNNQQADMLALMQGIVVQDQPPAQEVMEDNTPVQQVANAAVVDNVQLQMLQILQTMQAAQQQMQQQGNQNGASNQQANGGGNRNRNQNGGGRQRVNRRTPDNATFNRRDTSAYCHTHGACNHTSMDCNKKAPGHKNTATLENRMGGSNAFCQQAADE